MSEYFSNYPKIAYDITGTNNTNPDFSLAVNLMVRNKIRDAVESDITIFYPYVVPEGMRPDVLAYQYYGDTQYTWSILLVNNIIEKSQTTVHQYLKQARARVDTSGTSDPIPVYNLEVDYQTYSRTNIEERSIVYKYEYEQDLNEARREIQLIDVNYIASVQDEIRRLFR